MGRSPGKIVHTHSAEIATSRIHRALRSRWTQALLGLGLVAAVALGSFAVVHRASAAAYEVCSACAYKSINDALAAAPAGATVVVDAGTYGPNEPGATIPDTHVVINKPVNLVGAGVGKSILNVAPANQGTATAGVISISTPSTPGNITISGFTLEGAIVNDSNDDGIMIVVNDHNASDIVTIQNNLFYGDTTLDPQLLADQTDSIYVANSSARVNVSNNGFQGVFRAMLVEGNPGPVYFTGNTLNLHGLYDLSVSPPALYFWAEGVLFLADNNVDVTSPQVVSDNTFQSYGGLGVGYDAGYNYGLVGRINNLSITGNVFNNDGVATDATPPYDAADIYLHGFGTTNGSVTSAISGVTISGNTFRMKSDDSHGYAIGFKGTVGVGNTITGNTMRAIGSVHSRPLAGINFTSLDGAANVSITNNVITGFVDGVQSDALPAGAQVSATQNCILGNINAGAEVAGGTSLTADHNWWGTATGPQAATNPSGKGNAIVGSVDYAPFLTKPVGACNGQAS